MSVRIFSPDEIVAGTIGALDRADGIMRELAQVYDLDSDRAQTAGLLHDAAKDMSLGAQLALAERAQITFTDPCERLPVYLHAPVSAYLVSSELGITDPMILNAIATHSYSADGGDSGTSFARCLRAADVLAPIQAWKGMRKLTDTIFAGKLAEAALLQCGWLIEYFQELGTPIHPALLRQFETLSGELGATPSFFERW